MSTPLVIAAHGSTDRRFLEVVADVAAAVRAARPDLDVAVGLLDHGPPTLAGTDCRGAVVVPLLLSAGYHVRVDIPAQAPGARVTPAVGPDPRLTGVLAQRLREAGYGGGDPVVLAAAGSGDDDARAGVRATASALSVHLGVPVTAAFVSAGLPRLSDLRPRAVATYLLAPGVFADTVAASGAVVAAPIGADPTVARIVVDRYEAAMAQVPGRTAPA